MWGPFGLIKLKYRNEEELQWSWSPSLIKNIEVKQSLLLFGAIMNDNIAETIIEYTSKLVCS